MKHKINRLVLLACIGMLATACTDDLNRFFDNPYWIHGEFNPSYGVPIGHGEIKLEEALDKIKDLPEEVAITYDETTDIVTLKYATTLHNEIAVEGENEENPDAKGTKEGESEVAENTYILSDSIPVNIRSTFASYIPDSNQLQLQNLFISLTSHITTLYSENTPSALEKWNAAFFLDSAKVYVRDTNGGDRILLAELNNSISLSGLVSDEGVTEQLFDKVDVSELIHLDFNEISYMVALRARIEGEATFTSVAHFLKDSLEITNFVLDNDILLEYPITGMISDLGQTFDVQMNTGDIDTWGIEIDTAQLVLEIENGIPLELCLQAHLADSMGNILCEAFPNSAHDTINAAGVQWNESSQSYISGTPSSSTHYITLNAERFRHLQRCRHIQIVMAASTSRNEADGTASNDSKMVSLRGQDKLKVRAYVQASPRYVFDTVIRLDNPFNF